MCERGPWGIRRSSLWGHDPREGCAELRRAPLCERSPMESPVELLSGHDPREGCAEMGRGRPADATTEAFGGAPYGATKRVRGVPEWTRVIMRTQPLGPSVELPVRPRNV